MTAVILDVINGFYWVALMVLLIYFAFTRVPHPPTVRSKCVVQGTRASTATQIQNIVDKFNYSRFSQIEGINIEYNGDSLYINDLKVVIQIEHLGDCGGLFESQGVVGLFNRAPMITIDPCHNNDETLAHEIAHAVDFAIREMSCHDSFWFTAFRAMYPQAKDYLRS